MTFRPGIAWVVLLLFYSGCSKKSEAVGPPQPQALALGMGSAATDDPWVIQAHDGNYYLVFISNQSGGNELYVSKSSTGFAWSTPIRITNNSAEDVFPQFVQTPDLNFHLTWQQAGAAGTNHVLYMTSPNPLDWSAATTIALTSGAVDDRYPSLTLLGSSELRVYFSRNTTSPAHYDLYSVSSMNLGGSWGTPATLSNVNSGTTSSILPSTHTESGTSYFLLFQRSPSGDPVDLASSVHLSTSSDSISWSSPTQVTANGSYNGLPCFFRAPLAQQWMLGWTSTVLSTPNGRGGLVSLDIGGTFPSDGVDLSARVGPDGWSPRTAGSLMVWVSAVSGTPALWGAINPL